MIDATGLTKRYGPLTALDHLDLTIPEGEIFGLLGPNGAGKTTTLRLMAGLTEPSAGSVRVAGRNPWTDADSVRRAMGVLLDGTGLYDRLTVAQNLRIFAGLYGVNGSRVEEALLRTGVADLKQRPAGKLSRGQRQRVALARAILHRPRVLFLDEPTAGLDPAAAESFRALAQELNAGGVTVVLCSHDMGEVDQLCHRIGILDRGRLLAVDTPARLKDAYGRRVVAAVVETEAGVSTYEWGLDAPDGPARLAECQARGRILSLHSSEATLTEVFLHLTGRRLA